MFWWLAADGFQSSWLILKDICGVINQAFFSIFKTKKYSVDEKKSIDSHMISNAKNTLLGNNDFPTYWEPLIFH